MKDFAVISDDEFLYRKVSVKSGWYDPLAKGLKPIAFKPRRDDTNGISFDRAKSPVHPDFRSLEQSAIGQSPHGYYIAVISVRDLRSNQFTVLADPIDGNPGHALLTDLTFANYEESREKTVLLAHRLVKSVEGPFHSESSNHG